MAFSVGFNFFCKQDDRRNFICFVIKRSEIFICKTLKPEGTLGLEIELELLRTLKQKLYENFYCNLRSLLMCNKLQLVG